MIEVLSSYERSRVGAKDTVCDKNRGTVRSIVPLRDGKPAMIVGIDGTLDVLNGTYMVYPGCNPLFLYRQYCKLNPGQKEAVRRVLVSHDYTLLLGLPGTGKTATLSLIVRALVARHERILLTSYTHSAVDNLMLKLIDEGMNPTYLLRLGSPESVHPTVHPFLLDDDGGDIVKATVRAAASRTLQSVNTDENANSDQKPKSVSNMGNLSALRRRCQSALVVACTVLAAPRSKVVRYMSRGKRDAEHAAFIVSAQPGRASVPAQEGHGRERDDEKDLSFGYCIVDEAGQISQPAALGPLMHAKKFMLVGDDYQLPPLVLSNSARSGGMEISLFNRLAQAYPEAVVCLSEQYRMNEQIMRVCNRLVYAHRMSCALPSVASARLELDNLPFTLPKGRHALRTDSSGAAICGFGPRAIREEWIFR